MISRDKNKQTTNISAALRADLEQVLGEYLDLKTLELLLEPTENCFVLTIFARARTIRNFKALS